MSAEAETHRAKAERERAVLDALAEAARKGDAQAMTQLGKRLLVGAAGARNPPEAAVVLLRKAANSGSAEAAAQLAVLAAIGLHVSQSWNDALGAIVFAAERGWLAAQGQLRVLAEDRELAAAAASGSADARLWARLAASIDLKRWHTAGAGENLSDSPLVRRIPEFAAPAVCRWMIEKARGRLVRALVYDALARTEAVSQTRTNTWAPFDIVQSDLVSVLIQARICASTGLPFRFLEPLTVLHYDVGEEISEHFDFVDPAVPHYEQELAQRGQRIVTFLLYLNDDYASGETALPRLGISHKGTCGEGLFFVNALEGRQPDERTLHAGRQPTRGEKWIVSQFIRDRRVF